MGMCKVSGGINPDETGSNLSAKGQPPNSRTTLLGLDGKPKQIRWFGPDGMTIHDRDFAHSGGMYFPHDHDWDWNKNPPRNPIHKLPNPDYDDSETEAACN